MRYRALDTNLLVMLDILLDTGSVTRTAETLGLSQPAISSALGRLRDHFGDELLVPNGRINLRTPLANELRQPLKDLLARTDSVISMRSGFDPQSDARCFSLMGSDYVTNVLGHDIVREVAKAGPGLKVEIKPIQPECFDQFERGEIDMAIVPSQVASAGHPTLPLFEDRYVCVVSSDHPTIGDSLSREQYLAARHVVRSIGNGNRRTVIDQWFLNQTSTQRRIAGEVPTFTDLLYSLVGTPLVATVQGKLAEKFAQILPIRLLDAPFAFPTLPLVLQWHRYLDRDHGLCWFRELVSRIAEPLAAETSRGA